MNVFHDSHHQRIPQAIFSFSRWETNELEIMWVHLIFKHFNLVLFIAPVIIWRNSSSPLWSRFLGTPQSNCCNLSSWAFEVFIKVNSILCGIKQINLFKIRNSFEFLFIVSMDPKLKLGVCVCRGSFRLNNTLVKVPASYNTNLSLRRFVISPCSPRMAGRGEVVHPLGDQKGHLRDVSMKY